MEQFGYVCGVYCRQQATARRIYIPVYANQKTVVAGKAQAKIKAIAAAVAVLVIALLGVWFWYAWFARNPKVVYSIQFPKADLNNPRSFSRPDEFYQLIGPAQLLSIKSRQVSLFDVNEQHTIWSAPLSSGAEKAAAKSDPDSDSAMSDDEEGGYYGSPHVVATSNDVWVAISDHLARFDRQTGSPKSTGIKEKILNISVRPDSIFVVSGERRKHEILANISLPDGNVETEEVNFVTNAPPKAKPVAPTAPAPNPVVVTRGRHGRFAAAANQPPVAQLKTFAAQAPAPSDDNADDSATLDDFETFFRQPYVPTGQNAVEMKTKLLEKKSVTHQAMKPKGKSVLDSGNVNASQGIELAQEMMNDARREETGGVEVENVSRYQVTLHRHLAKDVPDWTGEVSGPPQFFSLKTVDVLFAGEGLIVFDKQNKRLWDAKLTFPVTHHYMDEDASVPCIETKDALYFADAGTLTRFDLATGNVRWRYETVGITRMLADDHGGIYIVTSTAGPEQIQYSLQVNIHQKIKPVVMKIDAATGKVRWRNESIGDEIMLSGKFLYATRVSMTYALLRLEEGPDTHYNLNLLDPSNGSLIWNYHQGNRRVIKTEVQKNWILVQMEDEVVVMKFFSL